MTPRFFRSAAAFREWLEAHHATAEELIVGFHKKGSGLGGITYSEALDEALCFGWIDGVRRKLDANDFTIRFTPRKPRSVWSRINLGRVEALHAAGRMAPAGLAALARREEARTGVYSGENRQVVLDERRERELRERTSAWEFWSAQPPGYRRIASHWVMSAKQETTRDRRLAQLIEDAESGLRIALLRRPEKRS